MRSEMAPAESSSTTGDPGARQHRRQVGRARARSTTRRWGSAPGAAGRPPPRARRPAPPPARPAAGPRRPWRPRRPRRRSTPAGPAAAGSTGARPPPGRRSASSDRDDQVERVHRAVDDGELARRRSGQSARSSAAAARAARARRGSCPGVPAVVSCSSAALQVGQQRGVGHAGGQVEREVGLPRPARGGSGRGTWRRSRRRSCRGGRRCGWCPRGRAGPRPALTVVGESARAAATDADRRQPVPGGSAPSRTARLTAAGHALGAGLGQAGSQRAAARRPCFVT